jgi:hypothetical protein
MTRNAGEVSQLELLLSIPDAVITIQRFRKENYHPQTDATL